MKDLEWVIGNLKSERDKSNVHDSMYHFVDGIIDDLNQVEQPVMTTKQAWEVIEGKHGEETLANNIDYVKAKGYVVIGKPTIPKSVDARINEYKEDKAYDIRTMLNRSYRRISNLQADDADFWIDDNKEDFVMANIIGFTVEEQKRYEIRLPSGEGFDSDYALMDVHGRIWNDAYPSEYQLTEEEIKKIDPRYMAFAVPVGEEG